ncbi:MAG UNVERIFIED_CONTAM: hypothetical protein LVR18_14490 [Planctomycetaceae bacterium]
MLSGSPVRDEDDERLFYFPFTGQFASGSVEVQIVANAFSDSKGSSNVAVTQSFIVTAAEVALLDPQPNALLSAFELNQRGWIDVIFQTSDGTEIDPATIVDGQVEFELEGAGAAGVELDPDPIADPEQPGVFRYTFTGTFGSGPVRLLFAANSFAGLDGVGNAAGSQEFTAIGVTGELIGIAQDAIMGLSTLNARGYFDVRFAPAVADAALESQSDNGEDLPEFTLSGEAAADVVLSENARTSVGWHVAIFLHGSIHGR